jgi:hypothetical protein
MIGEVRFTIRGGEPAQAILDETGRWHCPRVPSLVRVLDALYDPRRGDHGDGPFGHAELEAVAAWLKGTALICTPAALEACEAA